MAFSSEPISVEVDLDRFTRSVDVIDQIYKKHLSTLGEYMVQWMREHGPKDTSVHVESIRYDVEVVGPGSYQLTVSSNSPGAKYALETGRGPGGFPNFDKILGWVQRRGLSDNQLAPVRAVGKRIGTTYFKRKLARSVTRRVGAATLEAVGEANRGQERVAYKVAVGIMRHGTRSKPFLFSEVVDATRNVRTDILAVIQADLNRQI